MKNFTKFFIFVFVLIIILLFIGYFNILQKEKTGLIEISNGFLEPLGNGSIKIVEFGDFQCPICKKSKAVIEEVVRKYDIALYFRHFPLKMHENSFSAALAASCANEQGKFWQYHDILFENQDNLQKENLKNYAEQLNLDTEIFNKCLDSEKYKKEIEKDIKEAKKAGVKGTPTFFVNGQKIEGFQSIEVFDNIIKEIQNITE